MKSIDMLDDWTKMMTFAREHDLIGNDILVFSALCVLCHNGPWELNYVELSNQSGCGSRTTAKRSCDTLLNKHLVAIANKMVYVLKSPFLDAGAQNVQSSAQNVQLGAQNVQLGAQNVQLGAQNVQFSEKERTKEKEINKEKIVGKKDQPTNNFLNLSFSPPSQQECYDYAIQNNIPQVVAQKWYYYQVQNSWTQANGRPIGVWQASLKGYALREYSDTTSSYNRQGGGEKPMTQQEKNLEIMAADRAREKAQKAKSEAYYDDHKSEILAQGEETYARILQKVHQSMAHMAQNPKK